MSETKKKYRKQVVFGTIYGCGGRSRFASLPGNGQRSLFGSVKPSPAALIRAATDGFESCPFKNRKEKSHPVWDDKIGLADFNALLSLQTAPTVQADTVEPTPVPTPKELAQQKAIMKVYRKYQQREYERTEHPTQFPCDYFFSALAELVLDD